MFEYNFSGRKVASTDKAILFQVSPDRAVWVPKGKLDEDGTATVSADWKFMVVSLENRTAQDSKKFRGIELFEEFGEYEMVDAVRV